MTNDLTEARDRLIPPSRLHEVAALLNMPHLDETAIPDDDDDALQSKQQAVLYADIAEWARLSAQAAEQLDELEPSEITDQFAYLVEYTDQHAKGWQPAPSEHSHGVTLADTAETVARTVLTGYISHLAERRDDYQLWLVDSLSLRASVWHVETAETRPRARRSYWPSSAHAYVEAGISPHAVEIRTPTQIYRFIDQHQLTPDAEEWGRGNDGVLD
ncbi:hypothetical protein GBF35_46475 [Nonomuraea phyllanthi]|uniref:hypothetical protein n=1 Tax=Nonomuraea phyllanthi TaxID=2219224 RepID=UPI001293F000|nr:hypothetical protein [Nonomuraea phyllanthi]QFY13020.1 hypothetical protein GBF35_46475 [Nonomuraea phyllanthi]